MNFRHSWAENVRYWKTVPRKSNAILMAGIFCLFIAFGLVLALLNGSWKYPEWAFAFALITGFCSIGYAYASFRRMIWMLAVVLVSQFLAMWGVGYAMTHHVRNLPARNWTAQLIASRLEFLGWLLMAFIMVGYILVVAFIRKEGQRVFGPLAEVQLAREVHQTLVPEIVSTIGPYELYGVSVPSGAVGGDLVDIIPSGSLWTAYVADVSGHGVPAGMIMAMVKSAVHMAASESLPMETQLGQLNCVLKRLFAPNAFVTFACLAARDADDLQFSVAGHPPILHYHNADASVQELSLENPPLAIFPQAGFITASFRFREGDVLAVITDGLLESTNKRGVELGLGPLKEVLCNSASRPLTAIAQGFREAALRHGPQMDDQTVLLVRRKRDQPIS